MNIFNKLSHQLLILIIIIFLAFFLTLGLILPQVIVPSAERNIYSYLREPLEFVQSDINQDLVTTEIAYIYKFGDTVAYSENIHDIININNINDILDNFTNDYGKFIYKNKIYYYYTLHNDDVTKIALTNDTYIEKTKQDILNAILPVVFLAFLIIALILILWGSFIVRKIEKLKNKIDNIDNNDYDHSLTFQIDDEMRSLEVAIEDMRISLKDQEEYRNQMYQNISHDFKTPLAVIKSYIEAYNDKIEDANTVIDVISEQTDKLEMKVHSLLYLNKLDYLKESKNVKYELVDVEKIIDTAIKEFKFRRKDVKFIVNFDKSSKFYGTYDYFETVIDNLLANFMRYTESTIKITAKNNRLTLYNDGPNIDPDLLEGIFTPFRKGIKGEFGLGLSIVKKTLLLMNYDIKVKNEKKGVSFIITKASK
ncbi:MAG TPA: HAMP domain-containing histidine kinase [Candidatus Onthousia faecavium]|nr:HAMP domain-containing histidine kinase [Candidatus Onthousia faecavium]